MRCRRTGQRYLHNRHGQDLKAAGYSSTNWPRGWPESLEISRPSSKVTWTCNSPWPFDCGQPPRRLRRGSALTSGYTFFVRLLIQLAQPGPLPPPVSELLRQAGATPSRASHAELPGLYTAEVPEGTDVDTLLQRLNRLPAVRHAEADAWGQAFS